MNKKVYFAITFLVLAALACGLSPVTTGNTPATKPPAGGGSTGPQILFKDDFSTVSSGWDRVTNESYSTDYASGGYRINVIPDSLLVFANPSQSFQNDVRIEVDATKSGGPDDNAFGVICRYQDVDNFYYFYISSDGYVGIGMDNAGIKSIISSSDGSMIDDSSINQGAATNHLRVDCVGSTLTLYVNGSQAATATDGSFTGGDVGLIARTYSVGGTDILFKNFFVYKP
jgi:pectate lyase